MGRKRLTEGSKHSPRLPYIAMVEGIDRGVPFRTYYKRLCCAFKDALATNGVVTDLRSLRRFRFINNTPGERNDRLRNRPQRLPRSLRKV